MITIKDVSKLNPTEIAMTASKRHIQSVIEDLILCVHEAEYNALRKESSEWLKEHDKEMLATAQAEIAELREDVERYRFALENVRLLSARHHKEDWALLILGFCAEAGVVGSVMR